MFLNSKALAKLALKNSLVDFITGLNIITFNMSPTRKMNTEFEEFIINTSPAIQGP